MGPPMTIDNAFYEDLGERWYRAQDDPVALLRAEARLRTAWVLASLPGPGLRVLDVGCGGGFLSNPLAEAGHETVGLDLSRGALAVARRHDGTGRVRYLAADALRLPFPDSSFDAVCAMDFLEHIPDPGVFLAEAARVLKPGGRFFFHTFNRNPVSHLVAIKGVEWTVRNTPRHMHVIEMFIKPRELAALCAGRGLAVRELRGVRPRVLCWPFLKLLLGGTVDDRFQFLFTRSLLLGYCGIAVKGGHAA